MDPSEPESLIYSLGLFGSKDPQLGVFFWSLHPGTGGTQASPPTSPSPSCLSLSPYLFGEGRELGLEAHFDN